MSDAMESGDTLTYYYYIGSLFRTLLVVDPLSKSDLNLADATGNFGFPDGFPEVPGFDVPDFDLPDTPSFDLPDQPNFDIPELPEQPGTQSATAGKLLKFISKRLKQYNPPDYIAASEMTWAYKILFAIEGFGSQSIGFSSTFASTKCGELGWSFVGNVNEGIVKNVQDSAWDAAIDATVLVLAEIEPLLEICIEASGEYEAGLEDYGRAVTD